MVAFIKFNKSVLKTPVPWRLWVALLVIGHFVIPLFFLNRIVVEVGCIEQLARRIVNRIFGIWG